MIKVSDYIAKFLVQNGICTVFTVVGGGAMHLNDSFGHNPYIHCIYQHHEQACSMAAEGHAKVHNQIAAICVTSGPGAINALNGVAGAYQDSIPMLVFSGQVKTSLTVRNSGLNLRTLGGQEFDIVSAVSNMTKYAEMVMDPTKIKYYLEKALYIAKSGRPGPCWLDVPLDIQSAIVDEDKLDIFNREKKEKEFQVNDGSISISDAIEKVVEKLGKAKRPVMYVGNGIRLSGALDELHKLIEQINIPVVTCWDSIDLIETNHPCYVGRGGTMGDRSGNFTVQNSDLVIAIGNRLSIYQVGYDINTWARKAYVVDVDIDSEELKKPTIRVDLPICADARNFIVRLLERTKNFGREIDYSWIEQCRKWKTDYPVVLDRHYKSSGKTNVYAFMDALSRECGGNSITVVANGSASVVGSQSFYIAKGQRFLMNCALSSMGYGLPSAIGACIANRDKVICIEGDGSIQMNIQELQTVVTNSLPIKIFIINNEGYHQIRQTQNNIFRNGLIGIGAESGDLGFPDFEKIAWAYGMPYKRINSNSELEAKIREVLDIDSYCMCEVMCSVDQIFEPKSATKRLEDGALISPPLEDLAPFLPKDELKKNMFIDLVEE